MSLLQHKPKIHAYVEVSYSESRKSEMIAVNEKNCTLLISLLTHHLEKLGATDIQAWAPKNKSRFADIVLEFTVEKESDLERAGKVLREVGGTSVGNVELFIEEE